MHEHIDIHYWRCSSKRLHPGRIVYSCEYVCSVAGAQTDGQRDFSNLDNKLLRSSTYANTIMVDLLDPYKGLSSDASFNAHLLSHLRCSTMGVRPLKLPRCQSSNQRLAASLLLLSKLPRILLYSLY